ncbi:MAG: hypothetical protein WBX15_07805 [Thermoanaerobaculia bacterium]
MTRTMFASNINDNARQDVTIPTITTASIGAPQRVQIPTHKPTPIKATRAIANATNEYMCSFPAGYDRLYSLKIRSIFGNVDPKYKIGLSSFLSRLISPIIIRRNMFERTNPDTTKLKRMTPTMTLALIGTPAFLRRAANLADAPAPGHHPRLTRPAAVLRRARFPEN